MARVENPCYWLLLLFLVFCTSCGCSPPSARLTFPTQPFSQAGEQTWYDVNQNGRPDFATSPGTSGQIDYLNYDDDEDGDVDRIYRLSDYAPDSVPHVVIMLDSIPYQAVVDRYEAGGLRMFGPPQKVIPPFPSLTEVCFTSVLHAPPLPGVIDQHYNPRTGRKRNGLWHRVNGYEQPWEQRLHYGAKFWEGGLSFLKPRPWYAGELERARAAVDDSPDRVTLVYIWSAASMVCKYGEEGLRETLDGAERLATQLLYERQGAIKISLMADHGHNLTPSTNVAVDEFLRDAGLHPAKSLRRPDDVVLEINGLVTYAAVQTTQPDRVADALLPHAEIELVMYKDGQRVVVRDAEGSAAIECDGQRVRYVPIDRDVLGYEQVVALLTESGKVSANGCVSDEDWLLATLNHEYPDAPRRIWDAFHGTAVNPPAVMFTLHDGYCAGLKEFENFIEMKSTHGSLNQANSATFVMSMIPGRVTAPMRSRDVLEQLEPGYEPAVRRVK